MAKVERIIITPTSPSLGGTILMSASNMKSLGISSGEHVVAFGARTLKCHVKEANKRRDPKAGVSVPVQVINKLLLPMDTKLTLIKKGNKLRFGYVFGIMANVKVENGQVVGQQEQAFRHLLHAADNLGMFGYVFSPLEIEWDTYTAIGYRLDDSGNWKSQQVPLPDVMYDQIITRTFQNRQDVKVAVERLHTLLAPRYFNPGYFDKWQVQQWLASDESTKQYVPETILFESVEASAPFLYRFPDVYIKPSHGSLGVRIIRARRRGDGQVYYQDKMPDGSLRQGTLGSVSVFLKKFDKRFRRGMYVIQETLSLMTWQERPFDIRLVLQKDGNGQWRRTKTFCRVAQEGEITSNLSTGGDAVTVRQLLQDVLQDSKHVESVMKEIRKVAADIPAVIEREVGSSVGELGLDLGLDTQGRVWVIEVNAKPWKKPNIEESEYKDLALLAFERPVQFARHLCEADSEL